MSKEGTLHLVYQRRYYDDEDHDYFFINYTIFRNVPLSQLNRLNNKDWKLISIRDPPKLSIKELYHNFNTTIAKNFNFSIVVDFL